MLTNMHHFARQTTRTFPGNWRRSSLRFIVKQRLPPSSIALFISRCRLVINISYICGRLIILLRLSAVSVTAHTPSGGPTKSCVLLLLWWASNPLPPSLPTLVQTPGLWFAIRTSWRRGQVASFSFWNRVCKGGVLAVGYSTGTFMYGETVEIPMQRDPWATGKFMRTKQMSWEVGGEVAVVIYFRFRMLRRWMLSVGGTCEGRRIKEGGCVNVSPGNFKDTVSVLCKWNWRKVL